MLLLYSGAVAPVQICMWDYEDPCNAFPTLAFDVFVDAFFMVRLTPPTHTHTHTSHAHAVLSFQPASAQSGASRSAPDRAGSGPRASHEAGLDPPCVYCGQPWHWRPRRAARAGSRAPPRIWGRLA